MKISVIVPLYNAEKYLRDCIESILSQTFTDFECMLIDDGSKDNSLNICFEYAAKDNRIKVIQNEHKGVSYARNTGLKMAKGEYISFVDSDDEISDSMFETMVNHMDNNDYDIVQCGYDYIMEDEKKSLPYTIESELEIVSGKDMLKKFGLEYSEIYFVLWNKLYKRSLFKNIEFPLGKLHEDEFVTYKIYYKTKRAVLLKDCMYSYYKRLGSITNTYSVNRLESFIEYNKLRINYFKKKDREIFNSMLYVFYITLFQNYEMCNKARFSRKQKKTLTLLAKEYYKEFCTIKRIKFKSKLHVWVRILLMTLYLPVSSKKCY